MLTKLLEKKHVCVLGAGFCLIKIALFFLIFFFPFYARQAETDLKEFEYKLSESINETRLSRSTKPLTQNAFLNASAAAKNNDMISRGYFSHTDPGGNSFSQFVDQVGYHYGVVGENIAMGFTTPDKTAAAWKNSRTHLANILDEQFEETGISVAAGIYRGSPTIFMTQHFAGPIMLASADEKKPFMVDAKKSSVIWEKSGMGIAFHLRVRTEGDVESAIAFLGQYEIPLQMEVNGKDWTGGIVTAESPESFFSVVTPPSVSLTSSNGIRLVETLQWKKIPLYSSDVDRYFPASLEKGISVIQQLLFYSNSVYVFFLVLFSLALVGNLRRGSCEQHDRMNLRAASMLVMLLVLLLIQPTYELTH